MRKRILVVEDTKVLADSIAELLAMEGYHVCVAYNGIQATAMLQPDTPDLIVTDIGMPQLSGYDLIRFVRSGIQAPPVPILVITADTTSEAEQRAVAVGASLFLGKPFNHEFLIDSVQQLLYHAQAEKIKL